MQRPSGNNANICSIKIIRGVNKRMNMIESENITDSMQSTIVKAEKLVAGYGDNIVWRDASFTIDRGQFVAIIGPNGAGKTTLFRLLLGLQQPISGDIRDIWRSAQSWQSSDRLRASAARNRYRNKY